MTALEDFRVAKRTAKNVHYAYVSAAGLDSPQNDKHRIECDFVELATVRWTPAVLHFRAVHGYYGDSGSYNDMSPATARYVARAITEMGKAIMERAAQLAAADAETARKAAEAEAREVLDATAVAS